MNRACRTTIANALQCIGQASPTRRVFAGLIVAAALLLAETAFGQESPVAAWQPGPGATGDNTYLGQIDTPNNGSSVAQTGLLVLSGWAVDSSAQGWSGVDNIQVFLGAMDGGKLIANGSVGVNRPDVAAALGNPYWSAAGWQAGVDPGVLPAGASQLAVYAHTPSKGWWFQQVTVNVAQTVSSTGEILAPAPALHGPPPTLTVETPRDGQSVSTRVRAFPITGTATDGTNGARGIDWVEVWLNGESNSEHGVILGVADMSRDGSWSLPFDPGAHDPLNSNLYVYAHSSVTGKTTLVVRHFSLTDRPVGQ